MNKNIENNLYANNYKARIKRINSVKEYEFNPNNNQHIQQNRVNQQHKNLKNYNNIKLNHVVFQTNKPKYHFNYGQPINKQVYIQQKFQNQQSNQKKNQQNAFINNFTLFPDTRKNNNIKQKQRDQSVRRTQIWGDNRKSSQKKRKLKIFPEKYEDQRQNANDLKQKAQIKFLKNQILKLKGQINPQKKRVSFSYNQSANKQLNHSQIQKLQIQRTKRMVQLQNYNQTLYNQLASKLKDIASDQYQFYMQKSKINKMHLQQIYQNSSAKKSIPQNKKHNHYNDNFIDINDFEQQYEQSFKQKDGPFHKQSLKNEKKQKIMNSQKMHNTNKTENIYSPFSLDQNFKETLKSTSNDFTANRETYQNVKQNIGQTYTFHKGKAQKQKASPNLTLNIGPARLSLQPNIEKIKQQNKKKQIFLNSKQQNKLNHHAKDIQKSDNRNLQIHDLNRELENKIQRKRIQSDYIKGTDIHFKHKLKQR